MGERSAIEWTDSTWNPWHGCTKVSPGCKHCYMYREKVQYGQDPSLVVRSKTTFKNPLKWKSPKRIFTCSWSDFFHETADPWRDEAWDIIRRTPQHTYLILTKRPERFTVPWSADEPWSHVWLGVSAETQEYADQRIPLLLEVPAARRFLSAEPLLGPISLSQPWVDYLAGWGVHPVHVCGGDEERCASSCPEPEQHQTTRLDWVIAGGESGPKSRPMELAWAATLRDQCTKAGVSFFLKQLGGISDKRGGDSAVLDGRRWTEVPA